MKHTLAVLCILSINLAYAAVINGHESSKTDQVIEQSWLERKPNAPPGNTILSTGGPDDFGYRWIDSYEPNGPVYNWIEINATGTNMNLTDDSHFWAIPFTFDFYGTSYDSIAVGSNGTVYFEDNYLGLANETIPGPNGYGVHTFIAVYWDDLNPDAGGAVYYEIMGDTLVVEWDSVAHYGSTTDFIKAQALLIASSGDIILQYYDPSSEAGSGATVGIQGIDTFPPVWGLEYLYDNPILDTALAIRFTTFVEAYDVGPYAIRVPGPIVPPMAAVDPIVAVENYGNVLATFGVTVEIDSAGTPVYSNTEPVVDLGPGDTLQVTFPTWNTGEEGVPYMCTAYTTYGNDTFPGNDTIAQPTMPFLLTWTLNSEYSNNLPTIDGFIAPGEWDDALRKDVSDIFGMGGNPTPPANAWLFVKNNASNLYLALDGFFDGTPDNDDAFWQYYDDNNDAAWPAAPDSSEGGVWFSWWPTGDTILFEPNFNTGPDIPYLTQLNGVASNTSGHMQFELVLPLSGSGGLNEELQAIVGDTVGFWFFSGDASTYAMYAWWPTEATTGWNDPTDFGDLVLAGEPGVEEHTQPEGTPAGYSLAPNHPNPFTTRTLISYSLPQPDNVTLAVYNISGQLVKTLVNTQRPAGTYNAIWDCTDNDGKEVAAGIYFYRMTTVTFSKTAKMIVVR
jgi:hypothetical protein